MSTTEDFAGPRLPTDTLKAMNIKVGTAAHALAVYVKTRRPDDDGSVLARALRYLRSRGTVADMILSGAPKGDKMVAKREISAAFMYGAGISRREFDIEVEDGNRRMLSAMSQSKGLRLFLKRNA